jgi:hypothetical protein
MQTSTKLLSIVPRVLATFARVRTKATYAPAHPALKLPSVGVPVGVPLGVRGIFAAAPAVAIATPRVEDTHIALVLSVLSVGLGLSPQVAHADDIEAFDQVHGEPKYVYTLCYEVDRCSVAYLMVDNCLRVQVWRFEVIIFL